MKQSLLALAALLLTLPASLHAASSSAKPPNAKERARNTEAIIQRVEQGLVPAIVVGGQPSPPLSIADEMRTRSVPGVSVAVIRDYQIDWTRSYGVTKADDGKPAATMPDTRFQIASLSKSMTAVAALRMVQDGRLTLDAPINNELKSWKLPENEHTRATPVTLRRLLNHTAGINNPNGPEGFYKAGTGPTLLQTLNGTPPAVTAPVAVQWPVGESVHYSSNAFVIVEQLLIDNAGVRTKKQADPFADILQREVFAPAGMRNATTKAPSSLDTSAGRFAWPHDATGKPCPEGPLECPAAPCGVWATAPDIARFVIALQNASQGRGKLLSKASADTMLTKGLENFGLGIGVVSDRETRYFGFGGASPGYQAVMVGYPETGEGAVVLANGDGGFDLAMEIVRAISREYAWPKHKPISRTPVTLSAAALQRFAGSYKSDEGIGDFTIRVQEGRGLDDVSNPPLLLEGEFGNQRLMPLSDNSLFSLDRDLVFTFDFNATDNANVGSIAFGTAFTDVIKRVVPDKPQGEQAK